jgi:HD-GYP domain-containing protein (c-di-GMP phosphodiesterase class II)
MDQAVGLASHRLLVALRDHDSETYGHCLCVGRYAERVAVAMGLSETDARRAGEVGCLHDIGKVSVPAKILRGDERLTADETAIVRGHAAIGGQLVAADQHLAHLARLVRAHHERMDGRGYPDGLKGREIPLESRIVAVADTFDALTVGRPYRPAGTVGDALTILTATHGLRWDPEVVDVFVTLIEREGTVPRGVPAMAPV